MYLAPHGYEPVPLTAGLWRHKTRDVVLSLVVDDFGVRYTDRATIETDSPTVEATSTTVPATPYTVDDGTNSFCSAALSDAGEWTEVTRKTKTRRSGRPLRMQGSTERSQETSLVKE